MKRIIDIFFLLITVVNVNSLDSQIYIEQNNQINNGSENYFVINDDKFDIIISNTNNKSIHIFAYHNDQMFSKYKYPIMCENTVMFHPASALINNANENKELTLYINREMQHNNISFDKRINVGDTAILRIKDIADIDNEFIGTLYLTIFIDYNENEILDQNEIGNISIFINKSYNTILFKAKVYISTVGYWVMDIRNPVYRREYFYVRITTEQERERFFELFGRNYPDSLNRIRELDYTKYNMYIIFSPITGEVILYNNPYHYNGEFKLIFDIAINKQSNRGMYVFARNCIVEKSKDRYEMWINDYGRLMRLEEMEL
jgi:hypothetical protein